MIEIDDGYADYASREIDKLLGELEEARAKAEQATALLLRLYDVEDVLDALIDDVREWLGEET